MSRRERSVRRSAIRVVPVLQWVATTVRICLPFGECFAANSALPGASIRTNQPQASYRDVAGNLANRAHHLRLKPKCKLIRI